MKGKGGSNLINDFLKVNNTLIMDKKQVAELKNTYLSKILQQKIQRVKMVKEKRCLEKQSSAFFTEKGFKKTQNFEHKLVFLKKIFTVTKKEERYNLPFSFTKLKQSL